jgi:hypothetical protein
VGIHRISLKFGYLGVHKYPIDNLLTFTGSLEFESVRILIFSIKFGFWEYRKHPLIWIYGLSKIICIPEL